MKTRIDGEGNIRQRKDGRWEVRLTIGIDFATGKSKRISKYANTQDEAVKLLRDMSMQYDVSPKCYEAMTLGEWLDLCLEVYMKNGLKQSTYNSYESYIRVHFKPTLGKVLLAELSPRLLQNYYNYKVTQEGLSPKTVVNLNLFLHKALSYAVSEGYIRSNPAASLNLPRGSKPQIEILTRDEQTLLMRGSYQHRYGVFVRLVLFTGLRLGELLGLQWEDIDFGYGVLHVRRTLNRLSKIGPVTEGEATTEIVIQEPKSENSIRTVPLLKPVIDDLRVWQSVQRQDRILASNNYFESGFVVTNPLGGYIEPRTFKDYYNQILELSGLHHFTFHALRHTFASRAMEQGMDPKTLSAILGHYSVSFTLDTYAHVLDDHKKDGMALMDNLYYKEPDIVNTASYAVIVTALDDGNFELSVPDFPDISILTANMQDGLALLKDNIHEEVLTSTRTIIPIHPSQIQLQPNQMIIQIPV